MKREQARLLAARLGAWSIAIAPFLSLVAFAALGASSGAWRRRSVRLAGGLGACCIFVIGAMAPTSRWPLTEPASATRAAANLLTAGAVLNPDAPASWRVQEALSLGRDASGTIASCFEIAPGGRVFQVAPYPAPQPTAVVSAALTVTRLQPAGHEVAELRLSAHGTGRGASVQFGDTAPTTVLLTIDGGVLESPSGRLVLAVRNVSEAPLAACIGGAEVWTGPLPEAAAAAPVSLAYSAPTLPHRLASGVHAALLSALVVLAVAGWSVAWRRWPDTLVVAIAVNALVLVAIGVVAFLERPSFLVGLVPHRNFVAAQLAALTLFIVFSRGSVRWRSVVLVVATVGLLALLEVRAATIGLIIGALVGALLAFARQWRWIIGLAVVLAVALVAAVALGASGEQQPIAGLAAFVSGEARWDLYQAAWAAIAERPWTGYGLGGSRDALLSVLPDHPTLFGHAHNVVLALALEFGVLPAVVGLAVITAAWIAALYRSRAAVAGLTVLLLSGAVDITLLVASGAATAAMLCGHTLASDRAAPVPVGRSADGPTTMQRRSPRGA